MSGKRYRQSLTTVDREKEYAPADAVRILKGFPAAKFDETIEVAFRLGVDTRKAEQALRERNYAFAETLADKAAALKKLGAGL